MEYPVVVDGIVSIGMRDDGFREILFDRRSITEIPGEIDDLVTGIIEHRRGYIERDIEWISTYGSWSDDYFSYNICSIYFDRDNYFCFCTAWFIFYDKRHFMIIAVIDSEFKTILI